MIGPAIGKLTAVTALAGLLGLAWIADRGQWFDPTPDPGPFVAVSNGHGGKIAMAVYEVTWDQWKSCYDGGGCAFLPKSKARGRAGVFPVTGINRLDADDYVAWLNLRTGRLYRLPSADEWNAASGGLSRRPKKKLFEDPRLAWAADYGSEQALPAKLMPAGAFGSSPDGVADLHGNVWEWTSSCVSPEADYNSCPAAWAAGEHEAILSVLIRNPAAGGCGSGVPPANTGLRLVRDN